MKKIIALLCAGLILGTNVTLTATDLIYTSSLNSYQATNYVFRKNDTALGFVRFNDGFTVLPDACANLGLLFPVSSIIDLRETGTMLLLQDLSLDKQISFSSGGNINGQGNVIKLSGDLTIPPNKIFHINGDTIIDANGHNILVGANAQIFVDTNVTLTLCNMSLTNQQHAPTFPPIRCGATASKLALDNVILKPTGDFLFLQGQLFIHDDVMVTGTSAFIYKSPVPSYITSGACWYFDNDTTLSITPASFTDALAPYTFALKLSSLSLQASQDYGQAVNSVNWNPNGNFLAMGGGSPAGGHQQLEVYNFNGASLTILPSTQINYGDIVFSVNWSPDGSFLAIGGFNPAGGHQQIEIYSFDGSSLTLLPATQISYGAGSVIYSVNWSPDGSFLAIGGYNPTAGHQQIEVYSFDGSSLTLLPATQISYGDWVLSVNWSPDGNFLAIGGTVSGGGHQPLEIYSFDGTTLTLLPSSQVAYGGAVYSVNWNQNGSFLAVAGNATSGGHQPLEVYSFDGTSLTLLPGSQIAYGPDKVISVNWYPDGKFLAIGGSSPAIGHQHIEAYAFDGSSLTLLPGSQVNYGTDNLVQSVNWSPNGRFLAIGGYLIISSPPPALEVYAADYVYDPALSLVTTYTDNNFIKMTDATSVLYLNGCSLQTTLTGSRFTQGNITFDNKVTCKSDTTLTLTAIILQATQAYGEAVNSINWSPNGKFLAIGGYNPSVSHQQLEVYSFDGSSLTLLPSSQINYGTTVNSVSWSPDGRFLAVGGNSPAGGHQQLEVYNFDGSSLTLLPGSQINYGINILSVSWSPDGRFLAVGGDFTSIGHQQIEIYSFDGSSLRLFSGSQINYQGFIFSVNWSPNGKFLAIGGYNPAIGHQHLELYAFNGSSLFIIPGSEINYASPSGWIQSVNWSPDSRFLAVGGVSPTTGHQQIEVYSFNGTSLILLPGTQVDYGLGSFIHSVNWSSDGNYLVIGGQDPTSGHQPIEVYNFDGSLLTLIPGSQINYGTIVNSVNWSPDNRFLAIGGNAPAGIHEEIEVYKSLYDPNPTTVASQGRVTFLPDASINFAIIGHGGMWRPDGNYLATGGIAANPGHGDLEAYSFDGTSLSLTYSIVNVGNVWQIDWRSDGDYLAVANQAPSPGHTQLEIYKFDNSSTLTVLAGTQINYASSGFSVNWRPDGNYLAVGGSVPTAGNAEFEVYSFDGTSLSLTYSVSPGFIVRTVSWSPDGNYVAMGTESPNAGHKELEVYQFNGSSLSLIASSSTAASVLSLDWSPDGNYLAVGQYAPNVGHTELEVYQFNGVSLSLLAGTQIEALVFTFSVHWSPDGNYLAIGGQSPFSDHKESEIYHFNGTSLTLMANMEIAYNNVINSVGWHPSQNYLALAGSPNTGSGSTNKALETYKLSFAFFARGRQAPSTGIVYGDSAKGDAYDVRINMLSGAQNDLFGVMNYDNVN